MTDESAKEFVVFNLIIISTPLFPEPGIIARFRCALAANAAPV
jgi:hypothetical protein